MKKQLKFLLCALILCVSVGTANAAKYWRLRVVSVLEGGGASEAKVMVSSSNGYPSSSDITSTDYTMPEATNSSRTYFFFVRPLINGYAKENLIGVFRDAACTDTLTNADNIYPASYDVDYVDEVNLAYYNKIPCYDTQAEADENITTIYMQFGYPKITKVEEHSVIIRDPYATASTYVDFYATNFKHPTEFSWSWGRGGNTSYGYVKEELIDKSRAVIGDSIIRWTIQYTAKNYHSGNSGNNYVGYALLRARDLKNSDKNTNTLGMGYVHFYVDLQPKFTLATNAMDWSHEGNALVETVYVGMEVPASSRPRLQNKLIIPTPYDDLTNMARNYATWTATITGDDAAQFKFANGTQSVTGSYSGDLLDVIYAPKVGGNHTANLHIVTSYMAANGEQTFTKDVPLSGIAEEKSIVAFTASGSSVASENESYDYGEIIGTNHKDVSVTLNLLGVSGLTKTWSDPDGAFEFDINDVDLTKMNQTLSFRAHRATPVAEPTDHTATLTISGTGAEGPVTGVLTLTYRALPLLKTEVTWNWETLKENATATNPLTTNSDGVWTLTHTGGVATYNAETYECTVPYLHHEPNLVEHFSLNIPQTDTYEAFVGNLEAKISAAPPTVMAINSQEDFEKYNIASYTGSYKADINAVHLFLSESVQFKCNGQYLLEFDLAAASTNNVNIIEYDSTDHPIRNVLAAHLSAGHHQFLISPAAYTVKVYQSYSSTMKAMDLCNLRFYECDTILPDYDIIGLVEDGGIVTPLDVTTIMANKRQVTVSLNAEAQQYFELQSAGKATGATLTFTDADGLGIYEMIQPVITVALKDGVNVEQAKTASAGRSCLLTFADDYTYNNEVVEIPVVVINAYDVTYKHHPHGSYTVTYKNDPEHPQTVSGSDYVKHLAYIAPSHCTVTISSPTPETGYAFQGWKINGEWYSRNQSVTVLLDQAATVEPVFTEGIVGNFMVDGAYYDDLAEALNVANAGIAVDEPTVIVARDVLLNEPATYTIPEGVTLLVPHNENLRELQLYPDLMLVNSATLENEAKLITAYRMLTLTDGVNIINNGTICVAGKMVTANGGRKSAYVTGACGVINMANGGHIEMNNGSTLYCWGLIKGQDMDQGNNTRDVGTITVNNGATIFEDFEVGDWRGGTATLNIYMNQERKLFPFQSYSIQNIEVPTTYTYGSLLRTYTNVYGGGGNNGAVFSMIGSNETMFLLKDAQSFVRKWYDPTTDLTCYELSGTAQLDALHIVVYISLSSEMFNLPVSNSMHIILKDCNMTLAKPLTVQPGAVVEVKAGATLNMAANIFMIDKDEWGKYIHNYYFRSFNTLTSHKNRGAEDSKDGLEDAKIIIDGTLNVVKNQGYVYSTAGGANLMGNGGGKVVFEGALPEPAELWHVLVASEEDSYVNWVSTPVTAANLCNEDGTYTRSVGSKTFYNVHGRWFREGYQNEEEDHTYTFTYMDSGNSGADVGTSAVYSHDKTGLEAREKWFNVEEVEGCPNWWIDANSYYYNYTLSDAWHQFIATETENLFSGSDNKLYEKDGCTFTPEIEIDDETCLYTIDEQTKALINSHFITLHPNPADAAYLNDAEDTYYICFKGCNWHEATPYPNEEKAYDIAEGGTYIWFEGEWMNVEREGDYFYTADPQTNVKTYYEYADGEWIVALPYVSVTDEIETRTFFSLPQAFTVASTKNNAVITILRDFEETTTHTSNPIKFTKQNTTCTLDLNGHTANITVTGSATAILNMIDINAAGSTFTITDNSGYNNGVLNLTSSVTTTNANKRWYGIYVTNGSLVLNEGTIKVVHEKQATSTSNQARASVVGVAAGKSFTMNGGTLDVKSNYNSIGVHVAGSTSAKATVTINGGTIKSETTQTSIPYGIYAVGGTVTVYDADVTVIAKTTDAKGIVADASTSNYFGTINIYGGTYTVKSNGRTSSSDNSAKSVGVYVTGTYTFNNTKPNTPKKFYRGEANIHGGTFSVTTTYTKSTTAYGIQSRGKLSVTGGNFTVQPIASTSYGIYLQDDTARISGGTFTVKATASAYGVLVSGYTPDDKTGRTYHPVAFVDGGTFNVSTTSKSTAYGVCVSANTRKITSTSSDYYAGNYASEGTATINGGTFTVYSKDSAAYALRVGGIATQSGASGYPTATGTPRCTVNGGKFKVSSKTSGKAFAASWQALPENFQIKGGYYDKTGNLAKYTVAPNAVIDLSQTTDPLAASGYTHKVAEAYLITFMNGEETLQSKYQDAGAAAIYNGSEPIRANTETNTFIFDGWSDNSDESTKDHAKGAALPEVTAERTYYAHFNPTTLKCRVTFDPRGGTCAEQYRYVTAGAKVGKLPSVTKTGYSLKGWYTATSNGSAISKNTVINEDRTFYALYNTNKYALTWNLEGGTVTTAGKYKTTAFPTVGTTGSPNANVYYTYAITAPVVTRAGYTFAGWDQPVISPMPAEAKTYTAQWTPNTNTAYTVRHMKQNPENLEEYILDVEENFTGTTDTYVSPKTKSYTGYVTPDRQTQQISGDGSMVVTYVYNLIPYTIIFDAETNGGTCDQEPIVVPYGKTIGSALASLPTATKEGNEFQGWFTKSVGGNAVTTDMVIQYNIGKVYAQFRAEADLDVDGEINISNNSTVVNTTVHITGRLTIDEGRTLTTTNLILEASNDESGEIIGNIVAEHAYFDLKLNTDARHWRAFGVPWQVNLTTNPLIDVETGRALQISRDYEIMYYDGYTRATEGPGANCWKYLKHYEESGQPVEELRPGQGYMIAFGSHVNTVRFVKKATAPIVYTGSFAVPANSGDDPANKGISSIANPMIYHATMDVGVGVAQVHDGGEIGSDGYTEVSIEDARFIVGKAVYVQVDDEQPVVIDHASGSSPAIAAAPARRAVRYAEKRYLSLEDYYMVTLTNTDGIESKLYVLPEEEKNDEYVIGHDLLKMGMNSKKPQIWVKRYKVNLGLNTTAPVNEVAEFPINIYAPAAGEYTLGLAAQPSDDYSVYLTLNGEAIWNLSNGAYTLSLNKGTVSSYGLRLSAKSPQVVTGIDEALVDAQGETRKVLINNQVFIIRGENVYSVDGQLVK